MGVDNHRPLVVDVARPRTYSGLILRALASDTLIIPLEELGLEDMLTSSFNDDQSDNEQSSPGGFRTVRGRLPFLENKMALPSYTARGLKC